jgi:hypothetical protein
LFTDQDALSQTYNLGNKFLLLRLSLAQSKKKLTKMQKEHNQAILSPSPSVGKEKVKTVKEF